MAVCSICSVLAMLSLPNCLSIVINQGINEAINGNKQLGESIILSQSGQMFLWTILSMAAGICSGYFCSKGMAKTTISIRREVFGKIQYFSPAEFDKFSTASLITRTSNDVTQIQNFTFSALMIAIMAPLMLIGGLFMSLTKSAQLSMVLLVLIPLIALAVGLISYFAIPLSTSMQSKQDKLNLVLREKLTGIRVTRAFGTEDYERERFLNADKDFMQTSLKLQRLLALLAPLLMFLVNMSTIALLIIGGSSVEIATKAGDLIAVIQYIAMIAIAIMAVCIVLSILPRAASAIRRVSQVINTDISIKDLEDQEKPTKIKGTVEFKDVSFRYPGADKDALEHISFKVEPGKTMAIIGGTGSGKSTILNLIPRFYDVTEGEVLVDGVNVKNMKLKKLRSLIGYALQKAFLFSGTINSNIEFGSCEELSDDQIKKAAKVSQSLEFIEAKDEKFDAPISRAGSNVSGGQRQRLSIARSIASEPEVYLFDDSFSALDFKTDAKLRADLLLITKKAAVIIVAQRISTIINSDNILVIDKGKCVGQGTHDELLETCPTYKEIYDSQISEEDLAHGK